MYGADATANHLSFDRTWQEATTGKYNMFSTGFLSTSQRLTFFSVSCSFALLQRSIPL